MIGKKLAVLVCTVVGVFVFQMGSFAQTTTFPSGSAIIDMGSESPTVANSLKPYGLVYTLLKNNNVPVSYVVNPDKPKDGIDFVYNGKSYRGGSFIVSSDYITSSVSAVLASWANQGVIIEYTNSSLTVNVTYRINFTPKWVLDKTNGAIAVNFLSAAGIPASGYTLKNVSQLGSCDDIFILPHADPDWSTHGNLYNWNKNQKGSIWAGCHAVSVLESLVDPDDASRKMNFLSTNGLVSFTQHHFTSTPFRNLLPGDPVGQYYQKTDNAQLNGSETVYLPKLGSSWNPGAKIINSSPGQRDIPTLSAGIAAENVYGRAFDDPTRGFVAYQASHDIGGITEDRIAAQRIFFNFSFFALHDKIPPIISAELSGQMNQMTANEVSSSLTANVTGSGTGFTYQWKATIDGMVTAGVFSNPTGASTTFTPSASISSAQTCIITCIVTESCGRVSFDTRKVKIIPPVSGNNLNIRDINESIDAACASAALSFNVFTGNTDANAGARTLVNITGLANGTLITSTNGDVTFTANANFKGTTSGQYTIANGIYPNATGNISITVGDPALSPALTTDAATALADQLTVINVLANDKNDGDVGTVNGGLLYIKDIQQKPTKGNVYINANGTLSYLSHRDPSSVGSDFFQYLACNTSNGYCSVGSVNITLAQDGCANGEYSTSLSPTTVTVSLSPSADTYLSLNDDTPLGADPADIELNSDFGFEKRPLMKFDLTGIPSSATVLSAVLSLTTSDIFLSDPGSTPFPADLYPVTSAWDVASVSWSNRTGGDTWGVAGGDFDMGNGVTFSDIYTDPSYPAGLIIASPNISTMVQGWVTTSATNNGMIIAGNPFSFGDYTLKFAGNGNPTYASPKLNITYLPTTPACFTIPANYKPILYPVSTSTSSALSVTINPQLDLNFYGRTNQVTGVTVPANGTATFNGTQVIYTPNGSFVGTDTLTFTVTDMDAGNLQTTTATIFIKVSRVAPSIRNDIATTQSGTPVTVVVGANDNDPQGSIAAPTIVSNAVNGTLTVVGNDIVYTPSAGFVGTDNFSYRRLGTASDACSVPLSGTANVAVTVTNRLPVANLTAIGTFSCAPVIINLLSVSSDPEGGALSITITGTPANGTLTAVGGGKYQYTPNNGFGAVDNFSYTVTDPLNATSLAATVSVTVSGTTNPNTAPIAVNDADSTQMGQAVYTDVILNDSDPNNDPLSISITGVGLLTPSTGTLELMPNNLIKYTPVAGFRGIITYQYRLIDTHPDCSGSGNMESVATVTINVKATPTTLSGTVINDLDVSAAGTFNNISTTNVPAEKGTNAGGALYVYAVDNGFKILDKTPVDYDGTYMLSNIPSQTTGISLFLSTETLEIGNSLTGGSLPNGYINTSPLRRTLETPTTLADMGPYDWGIKVNAAMDGGQISITGETLCGTSVIPHPIVSTASATGGSLTATGYFYKWQYSITSNVAGFHDIAGANATNLVPSSAITTTTYFRRVATNTNNLDGEKYSNVVLLSPQAKPVISVMPSTVTLGRGHLQAPSVGLSSTSDIVAVEYSWTPTSFLTALTMSGTNAAPLTSTEYTLTATSTISGCQTTATTLVKVLYPGEIGGSQANCGPFTPTAFTSVAPGSGLSVTGITYKWQSSSSGDWNSFTDIPGAESITYAPGLISSTTYFRRVALSGTGFAYTVAISVSINPVPTVSIAPVSVIIGTGLTTTFTASGVDLYTWSPVTHLNASNTATVMAGPLTATTVYTVIGTVTATSCSNTKSITVTVINPGQIGSNQENCGTFTPAILSSVADASGATGIAYSWERSTTSATSGFAAIDAATSSTYTPGSTTTATYFRRVASIGGLHFYSNVVTVTIKEIPVATSGNNSPLCAGSTLQLSSSGGAGFSWTGPNGFTSNLQHPSITSVTTAATGIYTVQVTAANGCVSTTTTTVTVYASPTIAIAPTSASINVGDNVSLTASGANIYSWSPSTGLSATNTAQVTAQPAATTTYTVTGTVSSTGCTNTNSVIVTVIPVGGLLPGLIGSDITICSNTAAAAFTSTAASGGTGTITYQWQYSTNNTTFNNIQGATAATYDAGTLTQTGYYRREAKTSTDAAVYSNTVKVTVQLSVVGTISGGGISVCSNINAGSLSLTGHTGSILRWESSANGFSTIANITNTASTQLFTNISATTQYRAVVQLGTCAIVTTAPVTITIKPLPVIGAISGPCAMARDSVKTFLVAPVANATGYIWQLPSGWTGSSTTNSIDVKAGATTGMITVTAVNSGCSGISSTASMPVTIIDYAKVTITATPTISAGNLTSTMLVSIQLFDVNGNVVNCSGGIATLCSNVASAVFSTVVDHNDGTYTSYLSSPANDIRICGTVGGIPISKTTNVTFTGPQGGIKGNGPILAHETPKLTFTFTAGTGPFNVIYRSEKSNKNDTLTKVVSGQPIPVALIPSTTLYRLVQIIDANGERRVDNFNRDTATIIVLAPKIVVTLKSDTPEHIGDSTWKTRLTLHVKNIGDLDLANVQVKLNLKEVFPNPVTYVLDSVTVNGTTVVKNSSYDGTQETDLFAKLRNLDNRMSADTRLQGGVFENQQILLSADGIEVYGDASGKGNTSEETEADEEKHSVYMFGPSSQLPVNVDGFMYLYLRIKPNGHHEPFVMQAVALGTGHTEEGSALTTSLSNDNENTAAHPEITEKGDPLPTVINLIPTPVIGVSLAASTPVDQGNGTYNVTLSYKLRNYGNVNLQSVHLYQNLARMIGAPSTFTLVSGVTTTGTLLPNPSFDARIDSNMFLPISELGYEAEATAQFTINITPNQLSALYRLQAQAYAVFADQNLTTTDLSTDGTNPDPDGNEIPSEKVLTLIVINQPIPPLVPPGIGINIDHPNRTIVLSRTYCESAVVRNIPTGIPTGGSGPYEFQWQISADNISFTDITGATDSVYITGTLISSVYLRMKVISDNQVAFTNAVHVVIVPAPAKPVITGTATQVVGTDNIRLSSSAATAYHWSTGSVLQSTNVTGAGGYTVTITDNNGCTATSDTYVITALDPYKVADILKRLTKAPELQSDGSFLMQFRVYASNLRNELIDSVRIKDDLRKVFTPSMNFEVMGIQASGSLIANNLYNGNSNIELVASGSQLPGLKTDSVQIAVKVFSNGFSGTLLNTADLTGKSPYGVFKISSNDPTVSNGVLARSPTPFFIPLVDLFIPSGFSPNRDGMNDLFVISRPYNTAINLEVFNRWGNLVFRNSDYKNDWAGRGNQPNNVLGEELPDGTYYYIVLATDKLTGSVRKFAGFITLKR
jgi:gliding motility-associated-like protein